MNAPAIQQHLQSIGADLRECCDALDDRDSVRDFLRNMHDSLPADVLAWHCYAEDRIEMSPQFRALSDEARRAVQWGFVPTGRLVCRVGMPVDTQHIEAAAEFLRVCRDSVAEDDDVWETAENARTELLVAIADREQEEDGLAEWRVARHERDSSWQSIGVFGD